MIDEKLNGLIKDALVEKSKAIKDDDKVVAAKKDAELRTYRMIKAKFMEFKTAKKAKPLDDAAEKSIIKEMVRLWGNEIEVCRNANREDRAATLQEELDVMNFIMDTMMPHVSEDEIRKHVNEVVEDGVAAKMGMYIGAVKKRCPDAEGSVIAAMVRERMSQLS